MLITSFLFSIIILIMYLASKKIQINRVVKLFVNTLLVLYLGIRYDFGNDYLQYKRLHYSVHQNLNNYFTTKIEKMYLLLNNYFESFEILVFVLGIFYILTINYFISKNLKLKDQWLAFLILLFNPYLFLIHLSTFRQTIVICIFILAFEYIVKKDWKKYITLILVSIGFHKTGVLLLPVYFIKLKLFKKYQSLILVFLGLFYFSLNKQFLSFLIDKLFFGNKNYLHYISSSSTNSLLALLVNVYLLCMFIIYIRYVKKESEQLIFRLSIVTFILYIYATKFPMLGRISSYFEVFTIVGISKVYLLIRNKQMKFLFLISLLCIYLFKYNNFFHNPIWISKYYYYKTIFEY